MNKNTSPSTIARRVASEQWTDVQHQQKLAKGVYWFDSAGHGGVVAVIGEAELSDKAVEAARQNGLTELVVRVDTGRRSRTAVSGLKYDRSTIEAWGAQNAAIGSTVTSTEVWVGEEDCDWATLAYASDAVRDALNKDREPGSESYVTKDYARQVCERWGNKGFVRALS